MVGQDLSSKLDLIIEGAAQLLPEFLLLLGAIGLLTLELFKKESRLLKTSVSIVILALTTTAAFANQRVGQIFDSALVTDQLSFVFEVIFLIALGFCLLFPKSKEDPRKTGEYHFLLFTLLVGAFLLIKAQNLLIFFLAIETISISSYILTSIGFKKNGFEAGIKYLLFGALASGVMLYGISLLYGLSGSLSIDQILAVESITSLHTVGLFMVSCGVLFKLSMVPMHIWTPDVYQSAPTSVVGLFSVVPKLAALVFLIRLVSTIQSQELANQLTQIVCWLSIGSMFLGNLAAIWQKNAKRLMAYSSIAHAGFLVIAVVVNNNFGLQSVILYSTVYAAMNLGTFYIIAVMEKNGLEEIEDYKGVGKILPLMSVFLLILMISLTGLPPTGGFTAKFLLFSALWQVYETSQHDYVFWLFIFGLINTVIALFYYLKIPYFSIFKSNNQLTGFDWSIKDRVMIGLLCLVILVLFFQPDILLDITNKYNFGLSYHP